MTHMVKMENGTSQTISEMLGCIERYSPDHLKTLENYVEEQAKNNTYDLEANLAVLKLYQFNPHVLNFDITYTILLKSLTNLPHTDFVMAKYLLLPQQVKDETVQTIIQLADILERADFILFWQRVDKNRELFRHITGFYDSIRKFVCHIVGITFQTIAKDLLKKLLGDIDESTLEQFMKRHGWKNQEYHREDRFQEPWWPHGAMPLNSTNPTVRSVRSFVNNKKKTLGVLVFLS